VSRIPRSVLVSTHPQIVSFSNVSLSDGIKIEDVVLDEDADQRSNFSWKHFLDIATTLQCLFKLLLGVFFPVINSPGFRFPATFGVATNPNH
jgi:hypothetical protein